MKMKNFEKFKDTLIELLKEDYILREKSKNWYKLKEFQDEIYTFFKEKFGYELIITSNMAKLQKFSIVGSKNKGITIFEKSEEYAILALSLDFLEDKYEGETILISELLEYIVSNYPVERDWKERGINLSLVKVLKYCESINLLNKLDGSEANFISQKEDELLYENTGFSKFFMNSLPFNISELDTIEKLRLYNQKNLKKEQIIRRELLENFIINSNFEYYDYLLQHRDTFALEFEHLLDMKLITFKEFSYLIKEEESSNISKSFPSRNNLEKILILFIYRLKEKNYIFDELLDEFEKFKTEYKSIFTKENLNMNTLDLLYKLIELSEKLNILNINKDIVKIGAFIRHFHVDLLRGDIDE